MLLTDCEITLVETKNKKLTLKVSDNQGREKTLHSMYDPETEAKSLVDAFQFHGKGILVVLGLGLGYHVAELLKRYPGTEVVVVEASEKISELTVEHGPRLNGNIEIVSGITSLEVVKKIAQFQMRDGLKPLSVFSLSSAVSTFPDYYKPILDSLNRTVSVKLWDRLRYPKFTGDTLNIVVVDSGYFLVKEVEKALTSLNHKVVKVSVRKGDKGESVISGLIEAILKYKPDFILTMNHLGFDEEGALASFLRSIEMPAASWYVDSPNLIVKAFEENVSPYMSLFLWDRTYIEDMKATGFEAVDYLPLATDTDVFKPMKNRRQESRVSREGYCCDVGFVGNSMTGPADEWMLKVDSEFHAVVERLAERLAYSKSPDDSIIEMLQDDEKIIFSRFSEKERMALEAAVIWKATLIYRLSCLKRLEGFGLHVHGDSGWKNLFNSKEVKILPPLNYYKKLPLFYNACRINFNATSIQMREAVNQRVFDVPACGAFILTDYQKSLEELFDVGEEIIVYKDQDEIPGLVKFYLNNSAMRDAVACKGRARVLKEHTYRHRIVRLIQCMEKRYK